MSRRPTLHPPLPFRSEATRRLPSLGRRQFAKGLVLLAAPLLPSMGRARELGGERATKEDAGGDVCPGARFGSAESVVDELDATPIDPSDPLAILYGRQLTFEHGEPLIPVRVLEGQRSFSFIPKGRLTITTRGPHQTVTRAPAGGRWTVRLKHSLPGQGVVRVQVGEHLVSDPEGARAEAELFRAQGYRVQLVGTGTVYGIAGRIVDTRRILVLLEVDGSENSALSLMAEIEERFGGRPSIHREPVRRSTGVIELQSPDGVIVATSPDALTLDVEDDAGFLVERVEHGMGYAHHGFEDRSYSGRLFAVVDATGGLAAVNLVSLERLTRGIVPSEIFASAHPEALKAQAVTARGEILAKVATRHLGDPYLLCSEQHCQVFRGTSGENPRTNAAVDDTRGQALFSANGTLVPSYYSAICGGHTENNDAVWGGPPDESIRGRPDFPLTDELAMFRDGIGEALLRRWLESDVPAYCRTSSFGRPAKFRWERTFSQDEIDAIAAPWEVGTVTGLVVEGRGVSGRAKTLVIRGTRKEARIHSELAIRRLFRMLDSGMFVIDSEGQGAGRRWIFRGGGWGHGAGMCQTGAIGRAESGATYRDILDHYFNGAQVVTMYSQVHR